MYLFELVFSFSLDKYLVVGFLDYIVVMFLIIWETSKLFSIVAVPIYIPANGAQGFPFIHILTSTCYFLSFGWQPFWQLVILIVVLMWISLLISDVEHLFMCLWTTCVFSLENVCSGSLPIFKLHNMVFCYWVTWVICMPWMLITYWIYGL